MSHLTLNVIETKAKHALLDTQNKVKILPLHFYIIYEVTFIQSFKYNTFEEKNWMSRLRIA